MLSAERVNCIKCDRVFYTDYDGQALDKPYHDRLGSRLCQQCREKDKKPKDEQIEHNSSDLPSR